VMPELMHYADTGCEVCPSCLRCPLPQCKYDDPIAYHRWKARARDAEIVAARRTLPVSAVATLFTLSPRTIHRALLRARATGLAAPMGRRRKVMA
jgi:hypothetical protein